MLGSIGTSSATTASTMITNDYQEMEYENKKLKIVLDPIDNGFIVDIHTNSSTSPKKIYIADLDGLPDTIASQMAAIKIGV